MSSNDTFIFRAQKYDKYLKLQRNKSREILFSGDVTDAPGPKGASELFYIGTSDTTSWLLSLNYYNHRLGDECPFKLFVAQSSPENIKKNYMVDPNKIVVTSNSSRGLGSMKSSLTNEQSTRKPAAVRTTRTRR